MFTEHVRRQSVEKARRLHQLEAAAQAVIEVWKTKKKLNLKNVFDISILTFLQTCNNVTNT